MAIKTFVVTGITSGIGKALAMGLAKTGERVVLVARNAERGNRVEQEIRSQTQDANIELVLSDLSSLSSVRNAAVVIKSTHEMIDVLVNNAAIYKQKREISTDGFELMFVTNHLGPFLLTHLLLDPLIASGSARILNITAPSTVELDFDDLQSEKNFYSLRTFGATKMMNLLFTFELARRLENSGVTVNAVHPGLARSSLMNEAGAITRFFLRLAAAPAERVARDIIRVAVEPEFEKVTGRFLHKAKEIEAPAYAHDRAAQKRLWEISSTLAEVSEVDIPPELTM
ncbi:MAG TPA: SDR family NAD(P)-dependent oxidoreductase [Anaerolineales bacterium]